MRFADWPELLALFLAVALPLMTEAGRLLRRRLGGKDEEFELGHGGQIASSALALLGLLIAFTFSMAAQRYESRRELVVSEANAISTAYLRSQLFDEPAKGRLGGAYADYVRARPAFVAAGLDPARLDAADARLAMVQARIWAETREAIRTPTGQPLTVGVLIATNEMFDLAASQRAALDARVPLGVRMSLVVFALFTAGIVGWTLEGRSSARPPALLALFVMVACAIGLIADLDQPRGGLIHVPQTPMEAVTRQILADQASRPTAEAQIAAPGTRRPSLALADQ
jgi:hypothetical protein